MYLSNFLFNEHFRCLCIFLESIIMNISGAFAFDKDSGFWLILSVPNFPAPRKQKYSYEHEQIRYAQSILCISIDRKYMKEMGDFFYFY